MMGHSDSFGIERRRCALRYPDEAANVADTYGRLYNWYAVDDARGLCPSGWHVPTDGEWTDLEDFITPKASAELRERP